MSISAVGILPHWNSFANYMSSLMIKVTLKSQWNQKKLKVSKLLKTTNGDGNQYLVEENLISQSGQKKWCQVETWHHIALIREFIMMVIIQLFFVKLHSLLTGEDNPLKVCMELHTLAFLTIAAPAFISRDCEGYLFESYWCSHLIQVLPVSSTPVHSAERRKEGIWGLKIL